MVIIHVMGGLGNQLYQYALYEKFKTLGKEVKLDLYAYKTATGEDREWRSLELDLLDGIEYETCTSRERTLFLDNSMKPLDRIRRKIFGRKSRQVTEKGDYMPEIFDMEDVYLYGFWGCERYYTDIIPLLQDKIRFHKSDNEKNEMTIKRVRNENSVSIHVRRQDYLTVADGKRYMGICTEEYYREAINYIRQRVENPKFYIFSDDLEYAKTHFNAENMQVVDWNSGAESLYDMEIMSCCKHNICANSTFSMWGARLNKNKDKIMIRPLKHDNYDNADARTVHRNWQGWLLMDSNGRLR